MTNALTIYQQMDGLQTVAQALHASGYFSDVKSQAQAMVKVMAGAEIGLPPFAAMSGIHIVNGKPTLGANLIATMVKNDPRYDYRVKQADEAACVLTWYEGGAVVGESSFTMVEVRAGNIDKAWDKEKNAWKEKPTWKAYPSDMLFARALTRGARRYAPGIFGGAPIYTPEEMGVETDEEGHVIEGEVVVTTNGAKAVQSEPPPSYDATRTYADGSPVDVKAVDSYDAYLKAHDGNAPDNVHNLRNWYKGQKNGKAAQPGLAIENTDEAKAASDTAAGLFG